MNTTSLAGPPTLERIAAWAARIPGAEEETTTTTNNAAPVAESVCTREMHELATGFFDLAKQAAADRPITPDLYRDLADIVTGIERLSHRVDAERAARLQWLEVMAVETFNPGLKRALVALVAEMDRDE